MGARCPVEVGQVKNMDLGSDSGGMLRSQWSPKNWQYVVMNWISVRGPSYECPGQEQFPRTLNLPVNKCEQLLLLDSYCIMSECIEINSRSLPYS